MKTSVLLLVVLCASTVSAKDRQWKDAKVAKISSTVESDGAVVSRVGSTTVGGEIKTSAMYYWLETDDITYVVAVTYTPWRSRMAQPNGGHPLNITLNGKTKIAIDGNKCTHP